MPSPFAGMDPYMEGDLWTTVHAHLGTEIARQLSPKLYPKYVARAIRRYVLDTPEDIAVAASNMYPDVSVSEMSRATRLTGKTAVATAPLKLPTLMPSEVPHVSVWIRDSKHRRLVAGIELLSPTNKRGRPRHKYIARREHILMSSVHLLEIDLLRQGLRVPMQEPLPAADYFVLLSRAPNRPLTDVWPIRLGEKLPVVPVPLLPGDADVSLDLQAAFTSIYDEFHFELDIDYQEPPDVPFTPKQASWAEKLLRAAGKRSGRGTDGKRRGRPKSNGPP